jgi:hypothetical protein
MSQHDQAPPPMDADLRALLRGAKASFDAEAGRHVDAAFDRLSQALPAIDSAPAHPSSAGKSAPPMGLGKFALPVTATAVLAGFLGAAVTYLALPVRERIVYVDRPVLLQSPSPPPVPPPSVRVEDLPMAPRAVPSAPAPSDVSAERLLLDEARTAFSSGDYAKSLDRLGRHKARFPAGVLTEEREALAIRALAAGGNKAEAVKRARSFVTRYPESIMRPAVEAAANEP